MLPDQPYARRVLFETEPFAAIPSLGPLVPGHSLLCPKAHIHSFAESDRCLDDDFLTAKEGLRRTLTRLYDSPVHLFEHGMAKGATRILCTVEHAHLHFLPLPGRSFTGSLATDDRWVEFTGSLQTLRELVDGNEYILYEAPDGRSRILRSPTEMPESQYMRKLFAKWIGREEIWDWRASPNAALADEAWRRFVRFGRAPVFAGRDGW
jgi:diadenosine tetraphosphate (Ap4A) HIT family hydrolase